MTDDQPRPAARLVQEEGVLVATGGATVGDDTIRRLIDAGRRRTVSGMTQLPTVSVDEVPSGAVLLDVREDDEWADGHIAGAVHWPMMSVPQRLQSDHGPVTPDATVVVVCHVGGRSARVTAWLNANGYSAVNLAGGMAAWESAGKPVVTG